MTPEAIQEELDNLRHYHGLIESWTQSGKSGLVLVTLEGQLIHVSLTDEGWSSSRSTKLYPTIEALLMDESPMFAEEWHRRIEQRLINMHPVSTSSTDQDSEASLEPEES